MTSGLFIDADMCIGSGECVAVASTVFVLDGPTASVAEGAGASDDAALARLIDEAIAACPTGAITRPD